MSLSLHPRYNFRLGFTFGRRKGERKGARMIKRQREAYMHVYIHVRGCECYVHTNNTVHEVPYHFPPYIQDAYVLTHLRSVTFQRVYVCPLDITKKIKRLLD